MLYIKHAEGIGSVGRVLDWGLRGHWFNIHHCQGHSLTPCCVLEPYIYLLLSTALTQEDRKTSGHDIKIVDWYVNHQHKQTYHIQTHAWIQKVLSEGVQL